MLGHLGVLDENGLPYHPMGERNPDAPGLWFTGFKPIFTGMFDAAGIAARRIAREIAENTYDRTDRSAAGRSKSRAIATDAAAA